MAYRRPIIDMIMTSWQAVFRLGVVATVLALSGCGGSSVGSERGDYPLVSVTSGERMPND